MLTVLLEKRSAVDRPAVDPRRHQTLVEAPPYPLSSRVFDGPMGPTQVHENRLKGTGFSPYI